VAVSKAERRTEADMNQSIQDSKVVVPQADLAAAVTANEVWEANLHCRTKSYLLLHGQQGMKCDYEAMYQSWRADVKRAVSERLLAEYEPSEVPVNVTLTRALLVQAKPMIFDVRLPTDIGVVHFDGLKRVPGASGIGDFHYIPLLFHGGPKPRKEQKSLLELCGLLLGDVQGKVPSKAVVFSGKECRPATLRLSVDPSKVRRLIEDIESLRNAGQPLLILNDHCQVCEFRQQCRQQAVEQGNLTLLGIGEKETKAYARKGILNLTQLAHTFRPRRKGKRVERSKKRYHALQAMALRDKTVFVLGTPTLPASPVKVYLDVEGDPDEGYIYLIGMLVCDGVSEQSHSFWADSKDQEVAIVHQFLDVLARYEDFRVFCYGSYDKEFLKRMRPKVTGKKRLDRVLERLTNVLSVVYDHLYFPCFTNGLKDVAACLGFAWTEETASGIQSIVWRKQWDATHDDAWKQRLVTYNLDDCQALKRVADFLYFVTSKTASRSELPPNDAAGSLYPAVTWVAELDKLAGGPKWGDVDFFHPDYTYINRCAYFDYQRQRVFVRTSKRIRKSVRKAGTRPRHNRKLRLSQRVSIASPRCPACKSTNVVAVDRRTTPKIHTRRAKRVFDLVLTGGRIRRKVIECKAVVQKCGDCDAVFTPTKYERLDEHGHGLKCWAMFQHIAYGTSFETLSEMLKEFFDLHISRPQIHPFKAIMARYYKPTYRKLLQKLLSGTVVHADDTDVKLRTGKGYVSVLASMEEVVFMYRPTLAGDFMQDLLKDFRGVLVSDFHPNYDFFPGPQQKCLIHLMRDINQALLNSPFDQELQMISMPFGTLLRSVVETVDQYGLKRRHLKRHDRDVAKFFEFLSTLSIHSDAARSLQERLLRCHDKLFTFIQYDGVPWNNNCAENAIKRFAYYREDTVGTMTEDGLADYLTLLSICHTCRYKGVSFLKFLLSRERDLDAFCEGKHGKRKKPLLEAYPRGFTPAYMVHRHTSKSKESLDDDGPQTTDGTAKDRLLAESAH
jgi:predicted RecB family nuclease